MEKEKIYEKSIILSGPIGVGKSTVAKKLSAQTGMPHISTDDLRVLFSLKDLNEIKATVKKWAGIERLFELRELLPNLPNYYDMGFLTKTSNHLIDEHGSIAWHMYHKQYEIILFEELIKQLPCPAIIDLGGGVPISLDDEYAKLAKELQRRNPEAFAHDFDMSKIGFDKVKQMLAPFKNIIYLKLPEDYKTTNKKAAEEDLNDIFLASGQYEQTATQTINVQNMRCGEKINTEKLNEIVQSIIPHHFQSPPE